MTAYPDVLPVLPALSGPRLVAAAASIEAIERLTCPTCNVARSSPLLDPMPTLPVALCAAGGEGFFSVDTRHDISAALFALGGISDLILFIDHFRGTFFGAPVEVPFFDRPFFEVAW